MKLHETDDGLFCFLDEPEFSTLWYAFFRSKEAAEAAYRSHYKTRAALARAKPADLVQEACGGRCGDPHCNLSTEGELMRTPADPFPCRSDPRYRGTDYRAAPAKHADTDRLDWLSRRNYGFPVVSLSQHDLPAVITDHPSPHLRDAIDAAMKGGRT